MNSDWINIRFGTYHLQIGKVYWRWGYNHAHAPENRNPNWRWFKVYCFAGWRPR